MKHRFRVWHVCCHTLQFWVMSWNYAHIWLTGSRQNTYFCLCTRKHSVILPCINILVADYCIKSKYSHLCAIRNIAFKIYYYSFQRRLWGCANGKALHGCTAMLITIILVTIRNYLTWYFFLRWCTDWLKEIRSYPNWISVTWAQQNMQRIEQTIEDLHMQFWNTFTVQYSGELSVWCTIFFTISNYHEVICEYLPIHLFVLHGGTQFL